MMKHNSSKMPQRSFFKFFKFKNKNDQTPKTAAIVEQKSNVEMLSSFITLFLSVSTIHGFAHWTAERRHPVEIFIWFSLVVAAIYGAVTLSSATWTRYQTNPTVISMERDRYSWNTSFPSATICPTKKINEEFMENFVLDYPEAEREDVRKFLISLYESDYKSFNTIIPYKGIPSDRYMEILLDLQYGFSPSVSNSGAHGYRYTLIKVVTEMGICYTFNSNMAVYNSPGYWYSNSWKLYKENTTFFVHPLDGEVFANVVNMSTGFYFYLHGPHEVVDVSSKRVFSPNGHFLQIYLSGLTIFTSPNAQALSVPQRKCRFYDESNLRRSPVYSYVLCRMECRANLAKRLCNCIPHFYRNLTGDRICDVDGLRCLSQYTGNFYYSLQQDRFTLASGRDRLISLKRDCSHCFANCDDVHYSIEDIDTREWFLGSNLQWGLKEYPRMRLRRDVIFGFTDVLVAIGGMAGLFLGCSVLSFIEIIYFFTIRLFWYAVKYRKTTRELYNVAQ